ncbi:MAG TPA: sigma-70 family RNA polymerase sigma factor, partial [Actinopolymorphaceae bacterium]
MGDTLLVDEEFTSLVDPYRRELLAHCYRMLGSIHDAEDLVQETYVRAWRAYDRFEGRSSLRTWLHRIATRVCLTALEQQHKRPMPTGLGGPSGDPADDLLERPEIPWLEPIPDALIGVDDAHRSDPEAIITFRESVRLAFVAALQHLPPRQRAVLLLRDVLKWSAAEVAELLDTSTVAVNSALQRARAQLEKIAPTEDTVSEPSDDELRRVLEQYVSAFERKDVPAIVELFTRDIVWEMPPFPVWYEGPAAIGRHLELRCPGGPGDIRLTPCGANGQTAFGLYLRQDGSDAFEAFILQVL